MGTEALKLIITTAGQILRTKGTVERSLASVARCNRLIKETIVRCEKRKAGRKTGGN
jgi:hypothetical protein